MRDRARDYAILLAVTALVTLPCLGATHLWDMDEGVNAQAAREMRDADTVVIPTFNYELRTAKPVFLYWLQRTSYALFGVSEWSARLPSVLVSWLTVLLTYELGRRMFGRSAGLLSGIVLSSCVQFGVLSRAATPDATLLLFTVLAYFVFWSLHQNGNRSWWVPMSAACGLAMLTKGPVGVALPGLVLILYFAWNRELRRLWDRKFFWAAGTWILVAVPWFAFVAAETRGEWLKAFFGNENVNRFISPMEGHSGAVWYYPGAILVMFAPWSAFVIAALWYGVKGTRTVDDHSTEVEQSIRANRFLVCWVGAYVAFFTVAATKLPNYVYPVYPALAILTARFLIAWRDRELLLPRWLLWAGAAGLLVVGMVVAGGLLYADREFPGLGEWAWIGLLPVAGGVTFAWFARNENRHAAVTAVAITSVAFLALAAAFPPQVVDQQKAPHALVEAAGLNDTQRDMRLGTFAWFQQSVVFYTGREVAELKTLDEVKQFLIVPTPAYLLVPAPIWERYSHVVGGDYRVIARHRDFLERCDILVVTNVPQ